MATTKQYSAAFKAKVTLSAIRGDGTLAAQAGQVDVVVTHWPPTKGAMHPRFEGDSLSPYFYNDREDLVRAIGAKLWIAGHLHDHFDYQVGATRVVGNPAGYHDETSDPSLFRPDRIVEIGL